MNKEITAFFVQLKSKSPYSRQYLINSFHYSVHYKSDTYYYYVPPVIIIKKHIRIIKNCIALSCFICCDSLFCLKKYVQI